MQRFNEKKSVENVRQPRNERAAAQRPALSLEVEVLEARIAPAYFGTVWGTPPERYGPIGVAVCCE